MPRSKSTKPKAARKTAAIQKATPASRKLSADPSAWRRVWRTGFAPILSTAGLGKLREAIREDDPRLIQGATTTPPPFAIVLDWPVEAACALGFCGWLGDGLESVGEVEDHFAQCCLEADKLLGEPAACRWFLNWFDDAPRNVMRRELLAEVELELAARSESVVTKLRTP